MRKNIKIVLTGYRATGKSLIGRLLADKLGLQFVDTDKEIEAREGNPISRMVEEGGWDYFRAREKELLAELVPKNNLVIATGGGAILHEKTWKKLMESGFVVWLQADLPTMANRISADKATAGQRPSLTGKDITEEIRPVLELREPLYKKGSHISIDTSLDTPDDIVDFIVKSYSTNLSDQL